MGEFIPEAIIKGSELLYGICSNQNYVITCANSKACPYVVGEHIVLQLFPKKKVNLASKLEVHNVDILKEPYKVLHYLMNRTSMVGITEYTHGYGGGHCQIHLHSCIALLHRSTVE